METYYSPLRIRVQSLSKLCTVCSLMLCSPDSPGASAILNYLATVSGFLSAVCAAVGSVFAGIPDLVDSDDDGEENVPDLPASNHNLQDLVRAGAQSHGLDDLPPLVTSDDSGSGSVPDLESDHGDHEDVHFDHDSEYDDSESDEDDSELPPLVDIPQGLHTASFTDLGSSQPMTLDQLDAVDQLSHVMEESEDVAASGNLVCRRLPPHPPSQRYNLTPMCVQLCI